jgi:hypothetical protein
MMIDFYDDLGPGASLVRMRAKFAPRNSRMATGHFPLANIGNGLQCRFWRVSGDMPIYPFPAMVAGISENK